MSETIYIPQHVVEALRLPDVLSCPATVFRNFGSTVNGLEALPYAPSRKSQVWFTTTRKYLKSEEEGRAIIADKQCMDLMRSTAEAVVNRARQDGKRLESVHSNEPQLVVNVTGNDLLAGYTHYIELLTTAVHITASAA